MEVKFKKRAFIGGRFYSPGVRTVPDEFKDRLPSDAEALDAKTAKAEKDQAKAKSSAKSKPRPLSQHAKEEGLLPENINE